jgi:hypothetical protein
MSWRNEVSPTDFRVSIPRKLGDHKVPVVCVDEVTVAVTDEKSGSPPGIFFDQVA